MGKSVNRKLYKVFNPIHKNIIHSGGGPIAGHYALDPTQIDLMRVGPVVEGLWYTDGNHITTDPLLTHKSGWQYCGVQLYDHLTIGQVYLVYNPKHQKPLPVPLSTTTNERLPHPFQ